MARIQLVGLAAVVALAALVAACGGSSTSPSDSGSGGGSSTTPGPIAATITITASGVSPKSVTIPVGSSVNFVNNDSKPHDMASDPHPVHTDCPPINLVGILSPGQSRATAAMSPARTCGFHDHNDDTNTSLRGTIVVQ
jgi:plastocyanin